MYTLLLADDEFYTRQGILHEIDWEGIGIDRIIEADDGINALKKVEQVAPDLALLDVRMPRMDGIQLADRLRVQHPDCVIIFISGYSDKEYLRSAIRLQALQYVDKPIDNKQLYETLREAVKSCAEKKSKKKEMQGKSRAALACALTRPLNDGTAPARALECTGLKEDDFASAVTFLVKILFGADDGYDRKKSAQDAVASLLLRDLPVPGFQIIAGMLNEQIFVAHVFSGGKKVDHARLEGLLSELSASLRNVPHFIAAGIPVNGMQNVFRSYQAAVISLQHNFYKGIGSVTFYDGTERPAYSLKQGELDSFEQEIQRMDRAAAHAFLNRLTAGFQASSGAIPGNVKETYYQLTLKLANIAKKKHIACSVTQDNRHPLWETVSAVHTLKELHGFVWKLMVDYFDAASGQGGRNSTICAVESYIADSYADPDLSVGKIADKFRLTPAYLCQIFKREKGVTINRYITGCRLERAKADLGDVSLKISDIAFRSGYRDNNYFTKLFRQHVGMTPTEYREELLK